MNNPVEPDGNLEQRVEQIEREMKRIRFTLDHIKLDSGAAKESLDTIERRISETNKLLREVAQAQPDHSEKLDTLERGLQVIKHDIEAIHDVFVGDFDRIERSIGEVNATLSERFDHVDARMATKDDISALKTDITTLKATQERQESLLQEILSRLPPKQKG